MLLKSPRCCRRRPLVITKCDSVELCCPKICTETLLSDPRISYPLATCHRSEALGREALFTGGSAITALPPYLTVQMVRFYYKADVQQKAKILRKVCALPCLSEALFALNPAFADSRFGTWSQPSLPLGPASELTMWGDLPDFGPNKVHRCHTVLRRCNSRCSWTCTSLRRRS